MQTLDAEAKFNELMKFPGLELNPVARSCLNIYRHRHLKMLRSIETYLDGPRRTIADIGCHNGFFLRLASNSGFERLIGVDYFQSAPAQSYMTGVDGFEFVRANFNEDEFLSKLGDGEADCVVSTEVLEHIYHHPMGYLQECWRVLRPGGLLLLSTPNPCTFINAWRLATGRAVSWGGVMFAKTPKINDSGEPLAVWDIHFREYAPSELATIVGELPGVRVMEKGFIGTAVDPSFSFAKRVGISLQRALGPFRPLCQTQYMILRREDHH